MFHQDAEPVDGVLHYLPPPHPYRFEIQNLALEDWQLKSCKERMFKPLDEVSTRR